MLCLVQKNFPQKRTYKMGSPKDPDNLRLISLRYAKFRKAVWMIFHTVLEGYSLHIFVEQVYENFVRVYGIPHVKYQIFTTILQNQSKYS